MKYEYGDELHLFDSDLKINCSLTEIQRKILFNLITKGNPLSVFVEDVHTSLDFCNRVHRFVRFSKNYNTDKEMWRVFLKWQEDYKKIKKLIEKGRFYSSVLVTKEMEDSCFIELVDVYCKLELRKASLRLNGG